MNEFTALKGIRAPETPVFGYQRGDAVSADVVANWGLEVGVQVCEGDLDASAAAASAPVRPGPEGTRADLEAWAIASGKGEQWAAEASQDDLESIAAEPATADSDRPADSARKPEWVDFAVARGLDRAVAEGKTKAELQDWVSANGWSESAAASDSVALAATEANQA
jgi:hypothetical protein